MNISEMISQGTIYIGVLVALTNIITEVAKLNISWMSSSENINRFATVVGIVLTVISGIAYFQINNIRMYWYTIVAMVIVGIMVSFSAMLGYDKLISYFEGIGK